MHTTRNRTNALIGRNGCAATSTWVYGQLQAARNWVGGRTCMVWAAALTLGFFFLAGRVQAQIGGSGSISGTVTDSTGATVPGATVTATNTATNATVTQTTSNG